MRARRLGRPIDGLARMMPFIPWLGVEVGTYEGKFAEHMLKRWPGLRLHVIDPWETVEPDSEYAKTGDITARRSAGEWLKVRDACERRLARYGPSVTIWPMYDAACVDRFEDGGLDFVYIDSDHSKLGVEGALRRWHPKVRRGGLVAGHDYHDYRALSYGVIEAVDQWTTRHGYDLITGPGTVWGYIKP